MCTYKHEWQRARVAHLPAVLLVAQLVPHGREERTGRKHGRPHVDATGQLDQGQRLGRSHPLAVGGGGDGVGPPPEGGSGTIPIPISIAAISAALGEDGDEAQGRIDGEASQAGFRRPLLLRQRPLAGTAGTVRHGVPDPLEATAQAAGRGTGAGGERKREEDAAAGCRRGRSERGRGRSCKEKEGRQAEGGGGHWGHARELQVPLGLRASGGAIG